MKINKLFSSNGRTPFYWSEKIKEGKVSKYFKVKIVSDHVTLLELQCNGTARQRRG